MNTLYANGRVLTRAELQKHFHHIPAGELAKMSPHNARQPYRGDPAHRMRDTFHLKLATKMIAACGECQILRRKPVEDIVSWIDRDDYTGPAKRILIYGDEGVGKTMALNQLGQFIN